MTLFITLFLLSVSVEKPTVVLDQRKSGGEVKVESGKSEIVGEPVRSRSRAKNSWDKACRKWKSEMKQLNRKRLLAIDCGKPEVNRETVKGEPRYSLSSKGSYKIKITAE